MAEFEKYLNRRMWSDEGVLYFCRICGQYKLESEFYTRSDTAFGKDYKCKMHYTRKDEEHDPEMDYLKLNPLKEKDFEDAQRILQQLGYEFGSGTQSVHKQFLKRHNLE